MIYYNININNKVFIILLIIIVYKSKNKDLENPTNIPEFSYINQKKIKLLLPNNKCLPSLFFQVKNQTYNIPNNFEIKEVNLKDKNYFLSYYLCDPVYRQYQNLLQEHGFTRSIYYHGEHNLFLCPINENLFNKTEFPHFQINKYQKVFCFIKSRFLFQKNTLYKYYFSKKNLFPEDFNFMPETYIYPEDDNIIRKKFSNYSLNISDLWLVKPSDLYCGKKIEILKSLKNISLESYVITKYITKVNLIRGRKYDLRLFVLVTDLKPLRIYFYEEGFVRIATEIFSLNTTSINNKFVHLTNSGVNDKNEKFVKPNYYNDSKANTWSISMYSDFLKSFNVEWQSIRQKIKDIIIKSIICLYQELYKENELKKVNSQSFYDLLGYDILIDDKFSPNLLEINKNPTMGIGNVIENKIKKKLFTDTLNLVGITPYSRKTKKFYHIKDIDDYDDIDNNINNALCELEKPRGNYELIFPLKDNIHIYKKYFNIISEDNHKFWDKVLKSF